MRFGRQPRLRCLPMTNQPWVCPSCSHEALGSYCSQCGERRLVADELTWRAWFGQLLGGLFNLDGRLWRTLASLVFVPGQLAVRYCRGERVRWMRPVQLFLLVNLIYFLVQPHLGFNAFRTTLELQIERQSYSQWIRPLVEARIAARGVAPAEYATAFNALVGDLARLLLVLLIPLTALCMHLVAGGGGRRLLEHMVLATHYVAGQLLVFHVLLLAAVSVGMHRGWLRYEENLGMLTNLLLLVVWLTFAWRRFHGTSWVRAVVAAMLLAFAWVPTLLGYRLALFWLTYWLV